MNRRKKVLSITLVLLLGTGALFLLLANRARDYTNYPSMGTDIIAFGDSLVEGVGASDEDKNFVSLLSEKIDKPIINLGVSGNTTADGLSRLTQLNNYKPKVVLLLLGGNDHLRRIPKEVILENLGKIIEELQSRGAVVVLLGIRGNLITDRFDSELEELRDKYKTAYVPDVLDGLFGKEEYMSDAIHPNDRGYEIIAQKIYPVLLEVI